MSNKIAFGTTTADFKSFTGTYVHWDSHNMQEHLDLVAEKFDTLEDLKSHIDTIAANGGCSTMDDFVQGVAYADRSNGLVSVSEGQNGKTDPFVAGFWIIDNTPDYLKDENLREEYADDLESGEVEPGFSFDDYAGFAMSEEGIGLISKNEKFSATYYQVGGIRQPVFLR